MPIEPGASVPKARFPMGPHSPLAKLKRSQSGLKFPLRGSPAPKTDRSTCGAALTSAFAGLSDRAMLVPTDITYRPNDPLMAVLPLPKRS